MVRSLIRVAALLLVVMFPASAFARSQAGAMWSAPSGGAMSVLRYGTLQTEELPFFLLSCFSSMKLSVLDIHDDLGDVTPGQKVTIMLEAGNLAAPLPAQIAQDPQSKTLYAEASNFSVKRVINVLKMTGPLKVTVGKAKFIYSDFNRADSVKKFTNDCSTN